MADAFDGNTVSGNVIGVVTDGTKRPNDTGGHVSRLDINGTISNPPDDNNVTVEQVGGDIGTPGGMIVFSTAGGPAALPPHKFSGTVLVVPDGQLGNGDFPSGQAQRSLLNGSKLSPETRSSETLLLGDVREDSNWHLPRTIIQSGMWRKPAVDSVFADGDTNLAPDAFVTGLTLQGGQ